MKKVKIHPSFIIIWVLFLLFDKSEFVLYLFMSAAVHEFAHICIFLTYKADIKNILIMPFGVDVKLKNAADLSCKKEIIAALAGITANLIFALLLLLIPKNINTVGVEFFMACNVALAAVNLLPIIPLDGGRALYFTLLKFKNPLFARKICLTVAITLLIPLFLLGVYILVITKYNFSIILIVLYLTIYLLVKKTV